MGVTLFFTLSGFVLAINYFESLRRPDLRRIWNYFVARFARIYPLYLLVLVYIIVHQHAFGIGLAEWWPHVLAIQAWSPSIATAYGFNGPAWSISVEFFLYACVPLLFPMLARLRTARSVLIAAAGITLGMTALTAWFVASGRGQLPWADPGSAHRWLYRTPLTRLGDFTLGILAARLYVMARHQPHVRRVGAPLALCASAVTLVLMCWPSDVDSPWSWDVIYSVPAAIFIFALAVAPHSRPARMLSLPLIVLLGESSYAFYLIHQFTLVYFGAGRWTIGTSPTTILYECFTLGAIICLAIGLHIVVERPARIYIRRWATTSLPSDMPRASVLADRDPLPPGIPGGAMK